MYLFRQWLLIGAIVPNRDRRNRATFGPPQSGQVVIGEMARLNEANTKKDNFHLKVI